MVGFGATSGGLAYLIKPVFDDVLIQNENLVQVAALIIVLYLAKGLFSYFSTYLMSWVGQRTVMDLRNLLYQHVIRQSVSFFKSPADGNAHQPHYERCREDSASGLGCDGRLAHAELRAARLWRARVLLRLAARHFLFRGSAPRDLPARDSRPQAPAPNGYRARALARHHEHSPRNDLGEPHREGLSHGGVRDEALCRRHRQPLPDQYAHHPRHFDDASHHGARRRDRDGGGHMVRERSHSGVDDDARRVLVLHRGASS